MSDPTNANFSDTQFRDQPAALPKVPGYTVSREIAQGGMGPVYLAHDSVFGREVAVKVMHPGYDVNRFVVEARFTAQLPHPGVPPVYALGMLDDGRPFLAMKLIQGRTLADELKGAQPADLPRLLGVFERVCETVGFAHSRGIVHRNLKPANVMVGPFGEVLVMGWGLARELSGRGAPDETVPGQVRGTPSYMAPEQARGEAADARADVFALGGILCAILTGNPPFAGDTVRDTVFMAAHAELGDCFADIDACGADQELIAVTARCLAAAPHERYAHGAEVAAAVAAYRAGIEERLREAESARGAAETRALQQRKRRRMQLALLGLVLVLACTAGLVAWQREQRAGQRRAVDAGADAERKLSEERASADARQSVATNVTLASDLRKRYKFAAASAALAQAANQAQGAPEILAEVKQGQADVAFAAALDEIRYRKLVWIGEPGKVRFDTSEVAANYFKAFSDRRLNLTTLDPSEAARRIAGSAIRVELIAALDDWALHEKDTSLRDKLLEVARKADPHPWTDRLRNPALWDDGQPGTEFALPQYNGDIAVLNKRQQQVLAFAAESRPAEVTSDAVVVLVNLVQRAGFDPLPLLAEARAKRPADFELAFALGLQLQKRPAEAVGPLEAARALRPDVPAVWCDLGGALLASGDNAGAIAAYREAIRLNKEVAQAHFGLGSALNRCGLWAEAVAAYDEASRLDPNFVPVYGHKGAALLGAGQFDEALRALSAASKFGASDPTVLHNAARACIGKKDWNGAIQVCRTAAARSASDPIAYDLLGTALEGRGDTAEATAAWKKARELDPQAAQPQTRRADALRERGALDEAIIGYKEALRLDPTDALAHSGLARILADRNDLDSAVAEFKEAAKLAPKSTAALRQMGAALTKQGKLAEARAAYLEAVRIDPKLAETYEALGQMYLEMNEVDSAVEAFRAAVRARPTFPMYSGLGSALLRKFDYAGAAGAYREATRLDPRSGAAQAGLSAARRGNGDAPGAVAAARAAIKLDFLSADAQFQLGAALQLSGDGTGALSAYAEASRLDPKRTDALNSAGLLLLRRDPVGAKAQFQEAITRNPNDVTSRLNMGTLLANQNDPKGAIAELQEAARIAPADARPHIILGAVHLQQNSTAPAIAALRTAIRLNPKEPQAYVLLVDALERSGDVAGAQAALNDAVRLGVRFVTVPGKAPAPPVRPKP